MQEVYSQIMKVINTARDVKNNGYYSFRSPSMGPAESVCYTGLSLHNKSFI